MSPTMTFCSDGWQEDRSCILLPDFSPEEVQGFLDILYLKNLNHDELPASSELVDFLSDQGLDPGDSVKEIIKKDEEKFKKMPVEVKMEESQEHGELAKKNSAFSSTRANG